MVMMEVAMALLEKPEAVAMALMVVVALTVNGPVYF